MGLYNYYITSLCNNDIMIGFEVIHSSCRYGCAFVRIMSDHLADTLLCSSSSSSEMHESQVNDTVSRRGSSSEALSACLRYQLMETGEITIQNDFEESELLNNFEYTEADHPEEIKFFSDTSTEVCNKDLCRSAYHNYIVPTLHVLWTFFRHNLYMHIFTVFLLFNPLHLNEFYTRYPLTISIIQFNKSLIALP